MDKQEETNLFDRIDLGIKCGVAQAVGNHSNAWNLISIWKDGRVVKIPPWRTGEADDSSLSG